jgi:hypothetical protein
MKSPMTKEELAAWAKELIDRAEAGDIEAIKEVARLLDDEEEDE